MYSVKNPLSFIYNNTTKPYDWYTNNSLYQNHNLWVADGKGTYDPCPHGWGVAPDGTWLDLSTNTAPYYTQGTTIITVAHTTNGRKYNHSWYPSTGFLHYVTGALSYIGIGGYCWSAQSHEMYSKYLNYNMNEVNSSAIFYRAYGFPVRCIQE